MSYLIDTDLLSLLCRKGRFRKLEKFVEANEAGIFVSVVTWAEIEHGIGLTEEAFQEELRPWLARVRAQFAGATLPLDEGVLVRWKRLLSDLKSRNRTVTCEDSLIAATALHFDHTVLSGNTAHFLLTGVSVLNPME
ncbi:MAG TPA: PIN domain-containing protein [Verrucomicrobiota bacterium]|nr:PIN domain-containing protein [Verrucomicrobiota bacterium]HNU51788.1 PIN domain-containing protein [Verrucomicrobiota bacterium]